MNAKTDRLEQFKKHMARKLANCKNHIPHLSQLLRTEHFKEQPRECARIYQERTELVAEAEELQAVLDYLRDFEAEQAYDARTAQMLGTD